MKDRPGFACPAEGFALRLPASEYYRHCRKREYSNTFTMCQRYLAVDMPVLP